MQSIKFITLKFQFRASVEVDISSEDFTPESISRKNQNT